MTRDGLWVATIQVFLKVPKGEFLHQSLSQVAAELEGAWYLSPQECNPFAFGHREGALTSPSSPRTVSTSQNAAMPRWPSHSGTTW